MGGSGLAGEVLDAVLGPACPVQVVIVQSERLPGWVGAADAVFAVSASGQTAETLAMATEAARRGCRLACVGAKDSPLQRIAEQARAPFIPLTPAGLARSTLWGLAIPLLVIAERLGVARIAPDVYELTATRLEEVSHQCRPASESFVNPGKSLALDVLGTLPVLWGTSVLSGVAAHRFASQLSENAKYPAMTGVLPEAVYRQIATFDGPFTPSDRSSAPAAEVVEEPRLPAAGDELTGVPDLSSWEYEDPQSPAARGFTPLRLVLIADPEEDQRTAARRAAITELADQRGIGLSELAMDGEHPLVRLAGVIQLADYASVYLAIASGIDPGQSAAAADLQARIE